MTDQATPAPSASLSQPSSQPASGAADPRYDREHVRSYTAGVLEGCDTMTARLLRPQLGVK